MPDRLEWFSDFLRDSVDSIAVIGFLAQVSQGSYIAADEAAYLELAPKLNNAGAASRLVPQHLLPAAFAEDASVSRIVVIDTENEEAARERVRDALRERLSPQSPVESLELVTFFADLLPAMMAQRPAKTLVFDPFPSIEGTRLYAIVSTPRAGSTYLAHLLQSIGLGNPIEHMRPWVVDLLRNRPPDLFDLKRLIRRLIAFGRSGPTFGTKLIAHIMNDLRRALLAEELRYINQLAGRTTIIYLNRRNKLDQAISTLRAKKTGIWHSTDEKYRAADRYEGFEYDFEEMAHTIGYYLNEERWLAALVTDHPHLITVDYDRLSEAPGQLCRMLAERLGVFVCDEPTAKVEKLADSTSEALASRFISDAKKQHFNFTQFFDAEELLRATRRSSWARKLCL